MSRRKIFKHELPYNCFFSTLGGAALIAGVSGLVGAGIAASSASKNRESQENANAANIAMQEKINAANIASQEKINQEQIDYARSMTQAQWERDDNVHQREVADLMAAGLSPLANTAGSPVTSAMGYSPVNEGVAEAAQVQAPQFDSNALIESMLKGSELFERGISHQAENVSKGKELQNEAYKLTLMSREFDIREQQVINEYTVQMENAAIARQAMENNFKIDNKKLALDKNRIILEDLSRRNLQAVEQLAKYSDNGKIRVKPYTDFKLYEKAMIDDARALQSFLNSKRLSDYKTQSKGSNGSGGISGSVGAPVGNPLSPTSPVGTLSGSLNASHGSYESKSTNENKEALWIQEFRNRNPRPVFIYGVDTSKLYSYKNLIWE